jgi:hypothetical protein
VDLYGWGIGPGLGSSFSDPEPQMSQYPSNDLLIFNETDNAHFPLTSGAGKGIYLINLLNQFAPISPMFFCILLLFNNIRYHPILVFLLPSPTAEVAVVAIIPEDYEAGR